MCDKKNDHIRLLYSAFKLYFSSPFSILLYKMTGTPAGSWVGALRKAGVVSNGIRSRVGLQGPRMCRPLWSCGRFHALWPINFYLLSCLSPSGIESLTAMNSHSPSFCCCLVHSGSWSCQGCCSPLSAHLRIKKMVVCYTTKQMTKAILDLFRLSLSSSI